MNVREESEGNAPDVFTVVVVIVVDDVDGLEKDGDGGKANERRRRNDGQAERVVESAENDSF